MTAVVALSVEGREALAQRMARTTAPHLAFAVQQGDPDLVAALLAPLTMQDLYVLVVVLAGQAPPPLCRPEDGIFDEVAVQRAAAGGEVALTKAEQVAAMRLMHARGCPLREIADRFGFEHRQTVHKILARPVPEQTDLLRDVS